MKVAFLSLTKNVGGAELSLMQILNSCNYSFVVYPSERGQFTQLLDEYNYKYTLFWFGRYISNISSQSNKLLTSLLLFLYSIFCLVDLKLNKCNVVYLNNYKSLYVGYILSFFQEKLHLPYKR